MNVVATKMTIVATEVEKNVTLSRQKLRRMSRRLLQRRNRCCDIIMN